MKANNLIKITVEDLNTVKQQLIEYKNSGEILKISLETKKEIMINEPVKVLEVYDRFFVVELIDDEFNETYTVHIVDIASGKVTIKK